MKTYPVVGHRRSSRKPNAPLDSESRTPLEREDTTMFRIQNNIAPAATSLSQRLQNLAFDTKRQAPTPRETTTAPSQVVIVGRPSAAERQKAELAQVRQVNQSIAAAATVAHIAESGLDSIRVSMEDVYLLAQKAQEPSLSTAERLALASEVREAFRDIQQTAQTTRFNGIPLLNGAQQALTFQLGNGQQSTEVHLKLMDARPDTLLPGVSAESFSEPLFPRTVVEMIRQSIEAIRERVEKMEAFRERLTTTLGQMEEVVGMGGQQFRPIREADAAQQLLAQVRSQIAVQPAHSVALQAAMLSQGAMALIAP